MDPKRTNSIDRQPNNRLPPMKHTLIKNTEVAPEHEMIAPNKMVRDLGQV
jgi:hypothetical protein